MPRSSTPRRNFQRLLKRRLTRRTNIGEEGAPVYEKNSKAMATMAKNYHKKLQSDRPETPPEHSKGIIRGPPPRETSHSPVRRLQRYSTPKGPWSDNVLDGTSDVDRRDIGGVVDGTDGDDGRQTYEVDYDLAEYGQYMPICTKALIWDAQDKFLTRKELIQGHLAPMLGGP
ncbi:hypothetical protein B0H12DRAFT_1067237 [Mycena haematopus]|nr:hypothetical protein B0H12DRAFT_1067237 [Mycena haematopus]